MKTTKLAFYLIVFIALAIMSYVLSTCSDSNFDEFKGGTFEGKNNEPTAFSLKGGVSGSVSDGDEDVDILPTFAWEESQSTSGGTITYEIYIDTVNPPVNQINGDISSTNFTLESGDALQYSKLHYFLIVAKDSDGNRLESNVFSFTTIDEPDFSLTAAGGIKTIDDPFPVVSVRPTLTWEEPAAVTSPRTNASRTSGEFTYIVYIDSDYPPTDVEADSVLQTRYTPTRNLNDLDTFYWRVAAINTNNDTLKSDIKRFRTGNLTVLKSPANSDTAVSLLPTLDWDAPDGVTFQLSYLIYFSKDDPPTTIITTVTNTDYTFTSDTLDSNTPYSWRIGYANENGDTIKSEIWSFTTEDPVNIPPSPFELIATAGSTGAGVSLTPTLSWNAPDDPDGNNAQLRYLIYVGTNNPPTTLRTDTVTQTSYTLPASEALNGNTDYYWQIAVVDENGDTTRSSNVLSFTTENLPPSSFELIASAGSTGTDVSVTPTLSWNAPDDPDGNNAQLRYLVYVGTNNPPTTLITDSVTLASYTLSASEALNGNTTYYWRIAVVDSDGDTTRSSNVLSFTTENLPPTPFELIANSGSTGTDVSVTPTLSWNAPDDPDGDNAQLRYLVYVDSTNNNPLTNLITDTVTQTSFTFPSGEALNGNTTYYWQIAVVDANGDTTRSSNVLSFTTEASDPPSFVTGSAFTPVPGNDSMGVSYNPTFRWNSAGTSDIKYDLYLSYDSTNFFVKEADITDTSHTVTDTLFLYTNYFWKIVAKNSNGNDTTDVYKFTVKKPVFNKISTTFTPAVPTRTSQGTNAFVKNNRIWTGIYNEVFPKEHRLYSSADGITWNIRGRILYTNFPYEEGQTYALFGDSIVKTTKQTGGSGFQISKAYIPTNDNDTVIFESGTLVTADYRFSRTCFINFKNKLWLLGGGPSYQTVSLIKYTDSPSNAFTDATSSNKFSPRRLTNSIVFRDSLWIIGGMSSASTSHKDIWASSDGITWKIKNNNAPFGVRNRMGLVEFNGQLWLFGGVSVYRTVKYNDLWNSRDGVNWTEVYAHNSRAYYTYLFIFWTGFYLRCF